MDTTAHAESAKDANKPKTTVLGVIVLIPFIVLAFIAGIVFGLVFYPIRYGWPLIVFAALAVGWSQCASGTHDSPVDNYNRAQGMGMQYGADYGR
jgi:hypothetical protein